MLENNFKTIYKIISTNDLDDLEKFINLYGIDNVKSNTHARTFLMFAAIEKNIDIVKFLIKNHADLDIQDKEGFSALHFTIFEEEIEIVSLLVKSGCMVDIKDNQGNTPLWRSVMITDGDSPISKFLISAGANIDEKNNHDVSPRDLI